MTLRTSIEIERFQSVEIPVKSTVASRFNLPDINNLRGKKIVAIDAQYNGQNSIKWTPSGQDLINFDVIRSSYLTLMDCQSKQGISEVPLITLANQNRKGYVMHFAEIVIDISKCFIQVADVSLLLADTSFLLGFYYED